MLHDSLRAKLDTMSRRLLEIDARLGSPDLSPAELRAFGAERAELEPVVALHQQLLDAQRQAEQAAALLADAELHELAVQELRDAQLRQTSLEHALQLALLPRDVDDTRAAFVEVRAGAGGEESALFAGELVRMYSRYAERRGWRVELVSQSASDLGGVREAVLRISGDGVYGRLKFESGGHRVQRVPATEAQGRIHTSAATVAVLAEVPAEAAVTIHPAELRIDTFRASGAGGQHINKTDSAVRVTHLPTGLVVECQDDRSQHRNKARALEVLAARLLHRVKQEAQAREAAQRKSLVGSGDRSDRIRTYNLPQGRVTDHRINLTLHKIDAILGGDLDELLDALAAEHQAEQLAALAQP